MANEIVLNADSGPDFLYRYRNVDQLTLGYLGRTLVEHEVYLAAPPSLNDPFDCRIEFDTKGVSDREWRRHKNLELQLLEPGLSRADRRKRIAHDAKAAIHKSPDLWQSVQTELQSLANRVGVLCLTEAPDNVLMWSHYAAGHTGVCLKFRRRDSRFFERAQQVRYVDSQPPIRPTDPIAVGFEIMARLLTKTTAWAYEREWRIVDHENGFGVQTISHTDLSAVIVGLKTDNAVRAQVRSWLSQQQPLTEMLEVIEQDARLVVQPYQSGK